MAKKKPTFSHYVEYVIMLIMQHIIKILPLKVVVQFARLLTKFVAFFIKFRSEIILDNIGVAFPELDLQAKKKIRDRMYENIVMASFESYKYMYLTKKQKLKYLLLDKESEKLFYKINSLNKGCLVVGGHFGFFEAGGHFSTSVGVKSSFVVANQKNKLTEKLIDEPREKAGLGVIHRKKMRKLIEAVRDNHFIALLSDQDAGKRGVFVDFFGKRASTHKNAAVMALKYELPILLVSTVRDKKDITKHHIKFSEIAYDDLRNSDLTHDEIVLKIVQRYTKGIEDDVRKNPDHYWWVHKRYKTKEPQEEQSN